MSTVQTRPLAKRAAVVLLSDCICQNVDIVMEWCGEQVRDMADNWCDIKCGAIVVFEHNGKLEVLDGVKRLTAARLRQIPFIPVVVVTHP